MKRAGPEPICIERSLSRAALIQRLRDNGRRGPIGRPRFGSRIPIKRYVSDKQGEYSYRSNYIYSFIMYNHIGHIMKNKLSELI